MLAILAAAGDKGVSREKLLGILWADSSPEKARHALSQTLYSLRRDLGGEAVLSTPDLRLDAAVFSSDVADFRAAIAAEDWSRAAQLYDGAFLDGFYIADAPEFERWTEQARSDLERDGLAAIERVARKLSGDGKARDAADAWRRLARFDPLSGAYAAGYVEALAATGDRASALAHARTYREHLQRELDTVPDENFERVLAQLKSRPPLNRETRRARRAAEELTSPTLPTPQSIDTDAEPIPAEGVRRDRRLTFALGALGIVAAVVMILVIRDRAAGDREAGAVIAVGRVRDLVTPDSVRLGGVLGEMLTTSLARLHPLQVVSNTRMLELTPRDADTARIALADAARRAGATEVIEGELLPLPGGRLRLDIRRIDLERGRIRAGYEVSGDDRMVLLDSVTALIAADLRMAAPSRSLADVSTRSPLALRYYEDGLRAFYQFDAYAANRLFRAAIREDSMFAMATYYAWRSSVEISDSSQFSLGVRASRLAANASERDRLLILTHVGGTQNEARSVAAAESLGTRYANDPEALVRAAGVITDLRRRTALLNRAIALDSSAGTSVSAICRMCEAFGDLAQRYAWADSADQAERTLRRWIKLRPEDATPWFLLADRLISVGRRQEANAAQKRAEELGGKQGNETERRLTWSLRGDDVDGALSQCASTLAIDRESFDNTAWWCVIGLRMAGRFNDAKALVRDGRVPGSKTVWRGGTKDPVHGAILELESGDPLKAAKAFAGLGYYFGDSSRASAGWKARTTTWHLTLTATALVAGGDTAGARALLDSIETVGKRSLFERDPRLHHFVRGLLLARAGNHAAAVPHYRAAISSPTNGYTRINYELGKSLLALNRPAEAVPVMRAVLHGGLEGSGLYLPRTEAHELLARAFEASGRRDSAAVHYRVVARSWANSDPLLRERLAHARARQ
jgi:DNA-binding SARP family transcriptional activator/TolB-like protein